MKNYTQSETNFAAYKADLMNETACRIAVATGIFTVAFQDGYKDKLYRHNLGRGPHWSTTGKFNEGYSGYHVGGCFTFSAKDAWYTARSIQRMRIREKLDEAVKPRLP